MSQYLTTKEASEYLGVSVRTIQRYIKEKIVKTKKIQGKLSLDKVALEAIKKGGGTTDGATKSRQKDDKRHDTTGDSVSQNLKIPDGYILIDKDSLDTIKQELRDMRADFKKMMNTQQLLIEKGLNLRQLDATATQNDSDTTEKNDDTVADNVAKPDVKHSDKTATRDTIKIVADESGVVSSKKKPAKSRVGLYMLVILFVLIIVVMSLYLLDMTKVINLPI